MTCCHSDHLASMRAWKDWIDCSFTAAYSNMRCAYRARAHCCAASDALSRLLVPCATQLSDGQGLQRLLGNLLSSQLLTVLPSQAHACAQAVPPLHIKAIVHIALAWLQQHCVIRMHAFSDAGPAPLFICCNSFAGTASSSSDVCVSMRLDSCFAQRAETLSNGLCALVLHGLSCPDRSWILPLLTLFGP